MKRIALDLKNERAREVVLRLAARKAGRWDRDMESESILGAAHFGMGDNLAYGGTSKAADYSSRPSRKRNGCTWQPVATQLGVSPMPAQALRLLEIEGLSLA